MKITRHWWGALLLAFALISAVMLFIGCPGSEQEEFTDLAKRLTKQPKLTVYFHESKTKKTMPIEEYLLGVVAGEMKPGWPLEAYAAQAIVARTFTMDFLARGGTRELHNTDISTDEKEAQAYNATAITPLIRQAVKMTEGKVMTYQGKYVKGWFSASCGGKTALAKEGLAYKESEPAYMRSVSCPEEEVIPKEDLFWKNKFTGEEINTALGTLGKNIGKITRMEVKERSENSFRATMLKFIGEKGQADVEGADFRIAINPEKMRSIWITDINNETDGIGISGRGFGHGVGLCQWGSYALAKEGKKAEEIIKHYYPEITITEVW